MGNYLRPAKVFDFLGGIKEKLEHNIYLLNNGERIIIRCSAETSAHYWYQLQKGLFTYKIDSLVLIVGQLGICKIPMLTIKQWCNDGFICSDSKDNYKIDIRKINRHLQFYFVKNKITGMAKEPIPISNFLQQIEQFSSQSEQEVEAFLNATDEISGYKEKEVMIKYRIANQKIVADLKELYSDKCQICGENIGSEFGTTVVEGHHIEYFCKTQNNDSNNIIIVCPNHHSIIHRLNPIFNRDKLCFEYKDGITQPIKLNHHL